MSRCSIALDMGTRRSVGLVSDATADRTAQSAASLAELAARPTIVQRLAAEFPSGE
jgi:hypothetical protein